MESQKELIHSKDWDKLIILDATRPDIFEEVYEDYLAGDYKRVRSQGTDTLNWANGTFPDKYDIIYISGAVPIRSTATGVNGDSLDKSLFGITYDATKHFKEVIDAWDFGWIDKYGTTSPKAVTTEAYKHEEEKAIVHYEQPHAPFIGDTKILGLTGPEEGKGRGFKPVDKPIWDRVKSGDLSIEKLIQAYRDNLKLALSEARQLITNLEGEIIVTADHSNHLGEGGKCGHGQKDTFLTIVPWLEVEDTKWK